MAVKMETGHTFPEMNPDEARCPKCFPSGLFSVRIFIGQMPFPVIKPIIN